MATQKARIKVRLAIEATVILNGTDPKEILDNFGDIAYRAASDGLMTRGTEATVEEWESFTEDMESPK